MPATNFGWSVNHQPVYHVIGTKRKISQADDSQEHMCDVDTKRHCTYPQTDGMVTMDTQFNVTGAGDNQPPQSVPHIEHHTQVPCRVPPLPDHISYHGNNNNNNNIYDPCPDIHNNNNNTYQPSSQGYSQEEMIMDLNDECYSSTSMNLPQSSVTGNNLPPGVDMNLNPMTDAEYEAACYMTAAMEGEGAPDPQQYRQPCEHQGSAGSGHIGISSYTCKPSMEMTDTRPYVSDYY